MFDFENLEVYKKAKAFNAAVNRSVLRIETLDGVTKNQLRRASLSIVLNIAEGTSRFSKPDRRNFCVIARGSVFECVAVFDILKDNGQLSPEEFTTLYATAEEMSKMLFAMIRNLEN
ncbi:four helix bundle protein [Flavipsychrobacter stenotrophus]|uniref:Four helix bundle protein n=1 Tax=Flavipsychrobacter stenotrophus TaxID=2077091 RepID=A0A2S7SVP0_9BACT|nr:four helix bundle protein [Flavipsychrobacter stenotrophus]PQJ10794.1 four helix bundle protein [Flavipsychrobacter stenotrophus]